MILRNVAVLFALLLGGCVGELTANGGDGGRQPDRDGAVDADAHLTPRDGGPLDGDDAGVTARDGGTDRDAEVPPPDTGVPDPCEGIVCGANASCVDGACRCDAGYLDMGGVCTALPAGDPAGRTRAEVCAAWNAGRVENASPAWTAGSGACGTGTLASAAIDDTLRRVNMYRWLAGMPAVTHDGSRHAELMQCATMMSVNGALSHDPPTSWSCYTSGGASAAGRSNIALGYRTPGTAIEGYMRDRNVMSLGHRRWILAGRLGRVEIGFAAQDRPGQCLGVFDASGRSDRPWTAYPNQGIAPVQLAEDTWSFHVESINLNTSATVAVVRVSDGAPLTVDSYYIEGRGPPVSIGFTPVGWTPAAGETYRVTIRGTSIGDVTYDVELVAC